jgi:hypothetical protein
MRGTTPELREANIQLREQSMDVPIENFSVLGTRGGKMLGASNAYRILGHSLHSHLPR